MPASFRGRSGSELLRIDEYALYHAFDLETLAPVAYVRSVETGTALSLIRTQEPRKVWLARYLGRKMKDLVVTFVRGRHKPRQCSQIELSKSNEEVSALLDTCM